MLSRTLRTPRAALAATRSVATVGAGGGAVARGPAVVLRVRAAARAAPLTACRWEQWRPESSGPAGGGEAAGAKAVGRAGRAQRAGWLVDLMELSKAKLSAMVVVSTSAGFLMAGSPVDVGALVAVSGGTTLAAFSAATWNQLYEVRSDRAMSRTCKRPLPAGRVTAAQAAAWGALTGAGSVAVLAAGCNPLTAALGAGNILLYGAVYTPLKQVSVANTWVGAVVGAIPPLMGWAAATNSALAPEALSMAALLYLWQFPHFFALSWRSRADYAKGGYQMISVLDESGKRTAQLARRYAWYMAALPVATSLAGVTSVMFAVESVVVNAYALRLAHRFYENPNNANAQRVFLTSLWYLPLMMILMVFHSKNWEDQKKPHAQLSAEERFATLTQRLRAAAAWAWPDALAAGAEAAQPHHAADRDGDRAPPRAALEASVVDRAVTLVRKELSGLCPHEVMKEPECTTCPVGDRVVEEAHHVRQGAAIVGSTVARGVAVVEGAAVAVPSPPLRAAALSVDEDHGDAVARARAL